MNQRKPSLCKDIISIPAIFLREVGFLFENDAYMNQKKPFLCKDIISFPNPWGFKRRCKVFKKKER